MAQKIAYNTNIIILDHDPIKVTSVRARNKTSQFYTTVQNYNITGRKITLNKKYQNVIVDYDYDLGKDPEAVTNYVAFSDKYFNEELSSLIKRSASDQLSEKTTSAQKKRAAVEGTTLGTSVKKTSSGFTSITSNFSEVETATDEVVVALLSGDATGVKVVKELSTDEANEITTLTGKSSSGGLLNTVVVSGNAEGIEEALVNVIGTPKSATKATLRSVSPHADEVDTAIEEPIANNIANESEKIATRTVNLLNEPFKSVDPVTGQKGFGSLGLDFGNILGAILGKSMSLPQVRAFGQEIPSLPAGFKLPTGLTAPPAIIDKTSSTNIRNNLRNLAPLSAAVQNSNATYVIGQNNTKFTYPLPSTYEFKTIGGYEELERELRLSKRDITTAIVRWSLTYTDQWLDANDMHKEHTTLMVDALGGTEKAKRVSQTVGIQWHYVIRRDGVIQRGRPIEKKTYSGVDGIDNHSIHIGFIAGYNGPAGWEHSKVSADSINDAQWEAFDSFIKAFYSAIPGGQIYPYSKFNTQSRAPGFDVELYISGKYGKSNIETASVLSSEEVNSKPAAVVVSPSRSPHADFPALIPDTGPATSSLSPGEYNQKSRQANILSRELKALLKDIKEKYGRQIPNKVQTDIDLKTADLNKIEDELYGLRRNLRNNGYVWDATTQSFKKDA